MGAYGHFRAVKLIKRLIVMFGQPRYCESDTAERLHTPPKSVRIRLWTGLLRLPDQASAELAGCDRAGEREDNWYGRFWRQRILNFRTVPIRKV